MSKIKDIFNPNNFCIDDVLDELKKKKKKKKKKDKEKSKKKKHNKKLI